jgi:6-bladed beta-propeller protein
MRRIGLLGSKPLIIRPSERKVVFACFISLTLAATPSAGQGPPRWRLTHDTRVPLEGRSSYDFTNIVAVVPTSDGSVLIADVGNKEIAHFGATGEYLNKIGRTGKGPGEFDLLGSAGLLGDTVWVIDRGQPRTSLYSRSGRLLATIRTEGEASRPPGWHVQLDALLPDGSALGSATRRLADGELPTAILRMSRVGRTIDTLAWVPTKNSRFILVRPDRSFLALRASSKTSFGIQPFTDAPLITFAPSRSLVFIVHRAVSTTSANARFAVVAIASNGDTLWNRSFGYVPRPLARRAVDSLVSALEQSLTRTRSRMSAPEIRRLLFIPDHHAPVTSAFAGADGSLWLRREEDKPTVDYWVVGNNGRVIGTLSVPANVKLMAATGSKAWGVEYGEYDVPQVTRFAIQR